ncbi:hypothetical protein CcaverHIS002_0500110 [Cutaneotrichosporon cavernicola]|uniref:Fumarylacetoacetase-like C-terminal domain-containing protein n=1 Tax=Cutaneotrichosporon cavernicola TaxID=279322 RepID=A0AA48L7T9_9TREE|nr:uncharacterized protein CcaverHIS019_0600110 [Cutaneotrichosporon cavernicola]BEI84610.1 hypothetical protein CcaverHIS002_0500110 [Cutaneotrichosporon cavernicola]BEI93552.1 hypothetical protein CcaverHIS019_0600110 [Cutaneotrichosporon cavernicola]BEJ01329.1 hypothetical protein CcaverHIS631_0600110 [Cutaneotrichosporon cavernicola]BEJ09096.1 hypothetical protein CcaverHIS641_0600110 [Cutaneotrichosporon cavernicola]
MTLASNWTRLARFVGRNGAIRLGQPVDPKVDVGLAVAAGEPVEVFVVEGDIYTGMVTAERDVIQQLLSPISRDECNLIRCLGLNFKKHAEEAKMPFPNEPVMFVKPRTALAGPGELVVSRAAQDDQLDFETELALVIGRDARDVSEADAMDYVLGATCANDVSVRKHQLANSQWCFGKGFDGSCPLGPVLVRASALDPDALEFRGELSGETVQASNTNDMIFSCARAVAHLSQGTTLERGSVILMGTPSGIGWAREPRRIIRDGEEMRIWFEDVGTLVNTFKYE